jgi:hypothetical protein
MPGGEWVRGGKSSPKNLVLLAPASETTGQTAATWEVSSGEKEIFKLALEWTQVTIHPTVMILSLSSSMLGKESSNQHYSHPRALALEMMAALLLRTWIRGPGVPVLRKGDPCCKSFSWNSNEHVSLLSLGRHESVTRWIDLTSQGLSWTSSSEPPPRCHLGPCMWPTVFPSDTALYTCRCWQITPVL